MGWDTGTGKAQGNESAQAVKCRRGRGMLLAVFILNRRFQRRHQLSRFSLAVLGHQEPARWKRGRDHAHLDSKTITGSTWGSGAACASTGTSATRQSAHWVNPSRYSTPHCGQYMAPTDCCGFRIAASTPREKRGARDVLHGQASAGCQPARRIPSCPTRTAEESRSEL